MFNKKYLLYCYNRDDITYIQPKYLQKNKKLFRYQLEELKKMILIEKTQNIIVSDEPNYYCDINTQTCIYGSEVGAGKTITTLCLIKSDNEPKIKEMEENIDNFDTYSIRRRTRYDIDRINIFNSTLIIVPHGKIFLQWIQASKNFFKDFKLKSIGRKKDLESMKWTKNCIDSYDAILISDTFCNKFFEKFEENYPSNTYPNYIKWRRVIFDEADTIKITGKKWLHYIKSLFYWYISASYYNIRNATTRYIINKLRCLFYHRLYKHLILYSDPKFINMCRTLPPIYEKIYICKEPYYMRIVGNIIPKNIAGMINANDINGAVTALGGKVCKEDDILSIVTKDIQKKIRNIQRELRCIELQELCKNIKEKKIKNRKININKLKVTLKNIEDRIKNKDNQKCMICLDKFIEPIVLPCTHLYCAKCIFGWLQKGCKNQCPACKKIINVNDLMKISNNNFIKKTKKKKLMNKDDKLFEILQNTPNGKFLIFSNHDGTFRNLERKLKLRGINYRILMGSSASMNKSLTLFEQGDTKILMLNSKYNGAGINIPMTTDVVIFHKLDENLEKQVIGRAYRLGRKGPLTVHKLYHLNELTSIEDDGIE